MLLQKMNKKTIILIALLVISLISIAARGRFLLNQYEEECYQYGFYETSEIQMIPIWDVSDAGGNFSWGHIEYEATLLNYSHTNYSSCVKYILVRKV